MKKNKNQARDQMVPLYLKSKKRQQGTRKYSEYSENKPTRKTGWGKWWMWLGATVTLFLIGGVVLYAVIFIVLCMVIIGICSILLKF